MRGQFFVGPPQEKLAPLRGKRGSEPPKAHAVTSVGVPIFRRAAPRKISPLGGQRVHAVTSVGAML